MNILEKKETKIAAVVVSIILLIVMIITLFNQNTFEQTKKSIDHEAGEELVLNVSDFFEADDEVLAEIKIDASQVNADKVGEYKAVATYKGKRAEITVNVIDTTAPKVKFAHRYVFANDASNVDFTEMFESITDASEYTTKLIRFEHKGNLKLMDEKALKSLTDAINTHAKEEDLKAIGTENIPTEAGIYRSVLEIKDAYENASYEEVYVILDKTAASINEVADQTVAVPKEKLNEQPELNLELYKAYDEVDGNISSDQLNIEVSCRDAAKHEWIVKVSYTDRAGNASAGEFLITVVEETAASGNGGSNNGGGNTKPQTGTKPNNNPGTSGNQGNSGTTYDPMDANKDGFVSTGEEMGYITPAKQACIDAGYGVVVEMEGGKWYAVLMKSHDHTINGKDGWEILTEYLHERGLEGDVGGCWINMDNEWYWFQAENIREWFGEDGEIIW